MLKRIIVCGNVMCEKFHTELRRMLFERVETSKWLIDNCDVCLFRM